MSKTALSAPSNLPRPQLLFPLVALVLALALPWDGALLCLALPLYTCALLQSDQPRSTLMRVAFVWLFVLLGTMPLAIERAGGDSLIVWGGWGVSMTSINLMKHIALRAVTAFGAMLLLTTLCPMYRLIADMRRAGLPRLVVDLIELTYRYIYILDEMTRQIALAQVSRHGYTGGWRRRFEHLSLLISRTFVLAHSQADEMYDGLVSRGFEYDAEQTNASPATAERVLCLRDIRHRYRTDSYALAGINLTIDKGERIALLGENGAGKSTLMRLISGLMSVQEGEIYLSGEKIGRDNAGMRTLRQRIALVMQNANHQLFAPTVEEEIAFGLRNIGLRDEALHSEVEATIRRFDLESIRLLPPHKLSDGQKKWVTLAAILATDPDIILLDEPTASLDRRYTRRVVALLDDLHRAGKTIILSTHDMNLAYDWADRLLVMHQGHLIGDGDKDEIFADDEVIRLGNLERPLLFSPKSRSTIEQTDRDFSLALYHACPRLNALIVGGGRGALRKVQTLVAHSVRCTVLSPSLCAEIQSIVEDGRAVWVQGAYDTLYDIQPYNLIVSATGIGRLDSEISERAERLGILSSNLSAPTRGNIQFAAQQHSEGVDIAVRTHYRLPEVAQQIKEEIGLSLGQGLEADLALLAQKREEAKGIHPTDSETSDASLALMTEINELKQMVLDRIRYDWLNRH